MNFTEESLGDMFIIVCHIRVNVYKFHVHVYKIL